MENLTTTQKNCIYVFVNSIRRNHGIWHCLQCKNYNIEFCFILNQEKKYHLIEDIAKKNKTLEDLVSEQEIKINTEWCLDVAKKEKEKFVFILRPTNGMEFD